MPRRCKQRNPEDLRGELIELLHSFKDQLKSGTLRHKVLALIPVVNRLKDLGCSLIPKDFASSAQDRILAYLLEYPLTIVNGQELEVVAGISEWGKRVRELRVEMGWSIVTGKTANAMKEEGDLNIDGLDIESMGPDDYLLLSTDQDRDAAYRWKFASKIRKSNKAVIKKVLEFLRENAGKPVTGEELRYVANGRTEWARRVRQLRTEYGWPILTRASGGPDLPVGVYVLEEDRQSPEHDRTIPDMVRGTVLRRDGYKCVECGWTHNDYNRSDPRHLELHHVTPHVDRGANTEENLVTLCTVCHDVVHSKWGAE